MSRIHHHIDDETNYEYEPYEDIDDDGPEPITGWCKECGKECTGKQVDEGIGPYEFWGAPGVHHDWVTLSDCCDADVLDYPPDTEEAEEEE
jgi:hypothetical protein